MCIFFNCNKNSCCEKKIFNFVFNVMERERILREVFFNDEKSVVAYAVFKIVYDYLKRYFFKVGFIL